MPIINTRDKLNNAVELYLHRVISNETMDYFTDQATKRLGIDLRSNANQSTVTLSEVSPGTGMYLLPDNFEEMRTAKIQDTNGQLRALKPVSPMDSAQYQTTGPNAWVYWLLSQVEITPDQTAEYNMQVLPSSGQDVTINHWQRPQSLGKDKSESGGTTNPTLEAYPTLYLYATLIEAWAYVQGFAQSDKYYQLYQNELDRINKASNYALYGVGAAASAPARFYNSAPSRAM